MDGLVEREIVSKKTIRKYTRVLAIDFYWTRLRYIKSIKKLERAWKEKKLNSIIRQIAWVYGIPTNKMRVRYGSKSVSRDAIAHVVQNASIHAPIDIEFRESRKEILKNMSAHLFMFAVAHELAHVVLHARNHQFKQSEVATDILALIAGFAYDHAQFNKDGSIGYIRKNLLSFTHKNVFEFANKIYL